MSTNMQVLFRANHTRLCYFLSIDANSWYQCYRTIEMICTYIQHLTRRSYQSTYEAQSYTVSPVSSQIQKQNLLWRRSNKVPRILLDLHNTRDQVNFLWFQEFGLVVEFPTEI